MCRGLLQQISERERLSIKAFYIRLSDINYDSDQLQPLPDNLTLYYLPRINGSPLQIDGSDIRPDSPAFVTLHRVLSSEAVIYGSRERVRASSGARFEVYVRDEKLIKGIFRKGDGIREWKMECKCALEREMELGRVGVKEAEVFVAVEGRKEEEGMREKVDMVVRRRRRGGTAKSNNCYRGCLEEIPEEEAEENEAEGCCCCCSDCVALEVDDDEGGEVADMELEGVRRAVDVGFWMVCVGVGVGYLLSKASSSRRFRRRTFF